MKPGKSGKENQDTEDIELKLEVADHRKNLSHLDGTKKTNRVVALGLLFLILGMLILLSLFRSQSGG